MADKAPKVPPGDYYLKRKTDEDELEWEVVHKLIEDDDEYEDTLALVQTESVADVLLRHYTGSKLRFLPENWYGTQL